MTRRANETIILVADERKAVREQKRQILERAGFTVTEAASGEEALKLVARQQPDLVLLNPQLPGADGTGIAQQLRAAQPQSPALQIIHLSGSTAERRRSAMSREGDAFVTDPLDPRVLVATVNAMLRVRHAETALAHALESERRSRQAAEEATRLREEFLATLSHELRTPLNAMMGWIWQLRKSMLGEDTRQRALESLERNARIQAQLINDLLDLSRMSKGKLQLEMRMVDLRVVVEASVDLVKEGADRKHVPIEIHLLPLWTSGDTSRLQQVVTNLLTNAVQFTPERGSIRVDMRDEDGTAIVSVTDTGAGIEAAFLPHVFDQFRQAEGGLSRKHGGLGLGLSVVRELVELHGGTVAASSGGPGTGATFTVALPREAAPASETEHPPLLVGLRILVVDDSPSEGESLAAILESSGATVTTVPFASERRTLAEESFGALVEAPSPGDAPRTQFSDIESVPLVMAARPLQPANLVRSVARAAGQNIPSAPLTEEPSDL